MVFSEDHRRQPVTGAAAHSDRTQVEAQLYDRTGRVWGRTASTKMKTWMLDMLLIVNSLAQQKRRGVCCAVLRHVHGTSPTSDNRKKKKTVL